MVTDYAPMVRLMALVDEDLFQIQQSLHQAQTSADDVVEGGRGGGGRTTRNSSRLTCWLTGGPFVPGYERWLIGVGPEETRAAKKSVIAYA